MALKLGCFWFGAFTVLQLASTWWLLAAVSADLGGENLLAESYPAGLIIAGYVVYAAAMLFLIWAVLKKKFGWPVVLGGGMVLSGISLMTLRRAEVRERILSGLEGFDISKMWISPQWDLVSIFAVLLISGLAIVAWMSWAVAKGGTAERE